MEILAFPKAAFYAPNTVEDGLYNGPEDGMTLRDYFAAKAMLRFSPEYCRDNDIDYESIAKWAYSLADAMLKARHE